MPSKYHNKKVFVDGIWFDSMREANRWCELKLLQRAGEISELERQVSFKVLPDQKTTNGEIWRGIFYIADFVYLDKNGMTVVEDAKGVKTEGYIHKKKLLKFMYGYEIQEV